MAGETCLLVREMVEAYARGDLGEQARRLLEEHLEECPACRSLVGLRKPGENAPITRRGCLPRGVLSEVPPDGEDGSLVRRARRLMVTRVGRTLAVTLSAAAGVGLLLWYATAPFPPGLYLARLTASQFVIAPDDRHEGSAALPFLWVPVWPGQPLPQLGPVVIDFADGTSLAYDTVAPSLLGGTPAVSRARYGAVTLVRQPAVVEGSIIRLLGRDKIGRPVWDNAGAPYVVRDAATVSVLSPSGQVLAATDEAELRVVQLSGPLARSTPISAVSGHRWGIMAYAEGVTLLEVILPSGMSPLSLEQEPSEPGGDRPGLELPYTLSESEVVWTAPPARPAIFYVSPLVYYSLGGESGYGLAGGVLGFGNRPGLLEFETVRLLYDLSGVDRGGD